MNIFAQRLAIDKFHRDEVCAIGLANLVDVSYVRMIEPSRRLCLLDEPPHTFLIRSNFSGQNLQRDFAIELGILSEVHFTHPACAQRRKDLVRAKACAGCNGHFFTCALQLSSTVSTWG